MGVVFEIVAERVGEFPFFDFAPGADVEAFVQTGEGGGDVGKKGGVGVRDDKGGGKSGCENLVEELLVVRAGECRWAVFGRIATRWLDTPLDYLS